MRFNICCEKLLAKNICNRWWSVSWIFSLFIFRLWSIKTKNNRENYDFWNYFHIIKNCFYWNMSSKWLPRLVSHASIQVKIEKLECLEITYWCLKFSAELNLSYGLPCNDCKTCVYCLDVLVQNFSLNMTTLKKPIPNRKIVKVGFLSWFDSYVNGS